MIIISQFLDRQNLATLSDFSKFQNGIFTQNATLYTYIK